MQHLYTVRNGFAELASTGDGVREKYGTFVKSIEETTDMLIPTKKRTREGRLAADPRVEEARSEVQDAFRDYQIDTSKDNQQNLELKKEELQKLYQMIQEEEFSEMIMQVENADARSKHHHSSQRCKTRNY